MRKLIVVVVTVMVVASLTSLADASLSVGDRVRFSDGVGTTGGGEFGVYLQSNANPFAAGNSESYAFTTFCLERIEYIDFNTRGFIVDSISKSAEGGGVSGGTPDPLSAETAWLYYNFTLGSLAGYLGDVTSANNLQNAIWGFENEIAQNATWLANPFVVAAKAAVLAGGSDVTTAVARTYVVNILWATDRAGYDGVYEADGSIGPGDKAQSMLYVIPEASTLAVWSILSLCGIGVAYRKRG